MKFSFKILLISCLFLDKKAPTELEEADIKLSVEAGSKENRSRHSLNSTIEITASYDAGQTVIATYKTAMNRLSLHLNLKENLNDNTCLEVNETFLQALKAKQKATTVKTAIRQAHENFQITTARRNEPVAAFAGVLNTSFPLLSATANNNHAWYNFTPAKINLYHAVGEVTFQ